MLTAPKQKYKEPEAGHLVLPAFDLVGGWVEKREE